MSTNTRVDGVNRSYCVCNCITCCYFTLAAILFTMGAAVTVLSLCGDVRFVVSLGHLWLFGPVFLCSGLMIVVKTTLYARRQSMVALLTRRQREFNSPVEDIPSPRDPANYILPPSYDSIECGTTQTSSHLLPPNITYGVSISPPNHPPPCYEEALYGSSVEPIHFQGIKGYSLSKPDQTDDNDEETMNFKERRSP